MRSRDLPVSAAVTAPTVLACFLAPDHGARRLRPLVAAPAINLTATVESIVPSSRQLFAQYRPDAKHWST